MILRLRPTSGAGRFFRFSRMTESTISPHKMHRQPLKFIYPVSSLKSLNSSSIISLWHRGQSILIPPCPHGDHLGSRCQFKKAKDMPKERIQTLQGLTGFQFRPSRPNCFNMRQDIRSFFVLKQFLVPVHGPVVKGKPEIGVYENNEGRNQDDQYKQKNRHPFFQVQWHFSYQTGSY